MSNIIELKNRTDRELLVKQTSEIFDSSIKHDLRKSLCNWRNIKKLAQDGIRFRDKVTNVVTGEDNYFSRNY